MLDGPLERESESMNPSAESEIEQSFDELAQEETRRAPIRGACTGCGFEYVLSVKGLVRKHLSRTGPGECSGSRKEPDGGPFGGQGEFDELVQEMPHMVPGLLPEPKPESAPPEFETLAQLHPAGTGATDQEDGEPAQPAVQFMDPGPAQSAVQFMDPGPAQSAVQFMDPGPAQSPAAFEPVGGSPGPGDFDRWGRYLIDGEPHTRSTTFAKIGSNTKAIEQWNCRLTAAGLTRRPDLLALADGLDVKQDRTQLNSIVNQAKEAAGSKVSANLGTAYHAFTERLDAGCTALDDVPERYRDRVRQYAEAMSRAALTTRREWIERTTAVRADQVSAPLAVAGRLDRIAESPSGDRFIVDLKTGSDLSYGMAEIEVQLAIYAHGVNTFGLYDWNAKAWHPLDQPVRTDSAVVVHLPADGDGCTLLRVNIERGWRRAQLRGQLQADQKEKSFVQTLTVQDLAPLRTDPWAAEHMRFARTHFLAADSKERLATLYGFAMESGKYTAEQLGMLVSLGRERLGSLSRP
jgi:PD-(D/E)XK nuclease superfamily